MAKKKQKADQASALEKQLKGAVKKLRSQLATAEKSAEKWKARATDHRSVAAGAKAELGAVRRRLEKAEASAAKWKDRARPPAPAPAPPPTAATATATPAARTPATPDATWTVTALRAEARSRGVTGYSRKSKAQLLADLGA